MSPGAAEPVVCNCVRYALPYAGLLAIVAVPAAKPSVVTVKLAAVPVVDAAASPDAVTLGVVPATTTAATTLRPVPGAAVLTL